MAIVSQVQKKVRVSKWDVVKYQILTHCYLNKILLSNSDLDCLTLLSFNEPIELSNFCLDASSEDDSIFKSPQSVRNSLNKSEKNKLIIKDSKNKKVISLNPKLKIQVKGNILLDYKFFANESKEE
tara:strand:- start:833 stop:1210 length:378 start_codon:yes stop_codon:yes gene_type:complete